MPDTDRLTDELTRSQAPASGGFASLGSGGDMPAPAQGTLRDWRAMRGNPTIALARVVATMPVRIAPHAVEADDDVPEARVQFVEETLDRLWPRLIRDMLYAWDFGFAPFEKIWEPQDGLLTYRKLKYLLPEKTKVLLDAATGAFRGLRQGDIVVPSEKAFVYSYDREADNYYGRPRHENIRRDAWQPWMATMRRLDVYVKKAAGVVPMVHYPIGESQDAAGQTISNFEIAKQLLKSLDQANGVCIPQDLAAYGDLIKGGFDPQQFKAWTLKFLEAQPHSYELTGLVKHYESLMMRGWLVPERTALEGTAGTKAEAEAHADLAALVADLDFQEMLRHIQDYLVDDLLAVNWGDEARGSIRLVSRGTDTATRDFYRALVEKLLGTPASLERLLTVLDIDTLLDQSGTPMLSPEDARSQVMARNPVAARLTMAAPSPRPDEPRATWLGKTWRRVTGGKQP